MARSRADDRNLRPDRNQARAHVHAPGDRPPNVVQADRQVGHGSAAAPWPRSCDARCAPRWPSGQARHACHRRRRGGRHGQRCRIVLPPLAAHAHARCCGRRRASRPSAALAGGTAADDVGGATLRCGAARARRYGALPRAWSCPVVVAPMARASCPRRTAVCRHARHGVQRFCVGLFAWRRSAARHRLRCRGADRRDR